MNLNHRDYVKGRYKIDIPLYNEFAFGQKEGVMDVEEFYKDYFDLPKDEKLLKRKKHGEWMIDYIHESIP